MKRVPAVSVIIPTHNRAELVVRAIASVLAQSRPAEEVMVVDDGSTDGTCELVRGRFPTVRCEVLPQQRGPSAARNHGIAAANCPWLAFLDSDDEWLAAKLEEQLQALAREPEYLICHTDEIWVRHGRRVNPRRCHQKRGGFIFRHCLPRCAISPSSVLVHRTLLDRVGGFDETLPACEDYDLWLRVCARFPVLYLDRPLVRKHGGHADQLSRTVAAPDRYRIRALTGILESGCLGPEDRAAAIATLVEKIGIYAAGAARRRREAEVAELERLGERWRAELAATEA
jgi:glycosyltransferase involved in cell wall biosynthesis